MFAVWEPILITDWSAPTTFALRRLADRRVRQFWDKDHAMARLWPSRAIVIPILSAETDEELFGI